MMKEMLKIIMSLKKTGNSSEGKKIDNRLKLV